MFLLEKTVATTHAWKLTWNFCTKHFFFVTSVDAIKQVFEGVKVQILTWAPPADVEVQHTHTRYLFLSVNLYTDHFCVVNI